MARKVVASSTPAYRMPTGSAQAQLKVMNAQLANYEKVLKRERYNYKVWASKANNKKNRTRVAKAKALIARYEGLVKVVSAKRATVQNEVYRQTGQYDKLLSGQNRDAYSALVSLFKQYGLGSLANKIYEYVKDGRSGDTISLLLQDSPEYKKRFAANEARLKAGMSVLSPAEYIAVENSYRQIMRQSGLPVGFYDSNNDFTNFISADMSPTELQSRVDLATQATALANPSFKAALKQMGLSDGELTAYFLDKNKALPFLQKAAATAAIGSEALERGFAFDQQYAENLATQGVSREQAGQAYAQIGEEFTSLKTLGQIYGGDWTQRMAEEEAFTGGTEAGQQRKRLISQERGAFSGAAGGGRAGLSRPGGAT